MPNRPIHCVSSAAVTMRQRVSRDVSLQRQYMLQRLFQWRMRQRSKVHCPLKDLCRDGNGATHRMNYDTPPLRGSCWESLRILEGDRTTSTTCSAQEFLRIPRYSQESATDGRPIC